MNKKLAILSATLLVASTAMAQTAVKGRVLDKAGHPVIGAAVKVGTKTLAITDEQGNFTVSKLPAGTKQVVVSYIGMNPETVSVSGNMNVTLSESNTDLDEAIVVAYGTTKKSSFTGSAAVISSESLAKAQTSDVTKSIEGKIAGVTISNASGTPGANTTIRVRGIGSIFASNDPLVIVDGAPYNGDINTINPADIAGFTVLKDAASAALYGARGANGVVVITTKNANVGKTEVSVDAKWGGNFRGVPEYDVMTNPAEFYETMYRSLYNQQFYAQQNGGNAAFAAEVAQKSLIETLGYNIYNVADDQVVLPGKTVPYAGMINPNAQIKYKDANWNDWRGELFRPGLRQEYNVNVTRGNNKDRVFFSFGYLGDQGYNMNTYFQRFTTRLKYDTQLFDWLKFSNNAQYTSTKRNSVSEGGNYSNTFAWTRNIPVIYPVYRHNADGSLATNPFTGARLYDDGSVFRDKNGQIINGARIYGATMNPLVTQNENLDRTIGDRLNNSSAITITLPKGFEISSNFTLGKEWYHSTLYYSPLLGDAKNVGGRSTQERKSVTTINFNQILRWNKSFANGLELAAMVGHETYQNDEGFLQGEKTGFLKYGNPELWQGTKIVDLTSEARGYTLEGYFSQLTANFKNRYYASVSYRRDASSVFHPDHRWGDFWSFGGAWRVSEEEFYLPFKGMLSNLKLKASYGQQGNDYLLLPTGYRNWTPYQNVYKVSSNGSALSLTPLYMGNKDVTWETNHNFNIGLEFATRNNVISGEVEFFHRKTTDMLFDLPVPSSTGFTSKPANLGDMHNVGVEFTLNAKIYDTPNFRWTANLNATHYKNEIDRLPEEFRKDGLSYGGIQRLVEGRSIYEYYLVRSAGIDPKTGERLYWLKNKKDDPEFTQQKWDDTKTTFSQQFIGSSLPSVIGGFGTDFSYKGFDLSLQFAYSLGGSIIDYQYRGLMNPSNTENNWHRDILNSWSVENPTATLPRLEFGNRDLAQSDDVYLTNASYLSFRNVTLGYNLPASTMARLGISGMRVYAMADNVALLSARKGFDPRYSIRGNNSNATYSAIRTISVGVNVKF